MLTNVLYYYLAALNVYGTGIFLLIKMGQGFILFFPDTHLVGLDNKYRGVNSF